MIPSRFPCQLKILGPMLSFVYLETFNSPHVIVYFLLYKYMWHGSGFCFLICSSGILYSTWDHAPKPYFHFKLKFLQDLISSILQNLNCLEFFSLGLS